MEPINKQTQNIQVSNEQIPNNKPKKTWVEPELVSMGVESGTATSYAEAAYQSNLPPHS